VIFESIGAAGRTIVDANLGLVLLERKRFGPAREALQLALKAFEAQGRKSFAGVLHAALIPCAAGERDWLAFDAHLDAAIVIQQECRFVDVDVAKAATLAGDLCVEARERLRAERAWSFARDQWRGADRTPEAQNVQRRLNRLRASRQKPTRGSTE
jgi:hypothetical protein